VQEIRRTRRTEQGHNSGRQAHKPEKRDDKLPEMLQLQRAAGNQAVSMLVQRAPKDGPASTDAPGAKPSKPSGDKKADEGIHARVIGYAVDQGQGLITISAGSGQGVKAGMSGSLLDAGGKAYKDFTIENVSGGTSTAHVNANQDEVTAHLSVMIWASKYVDPNTRGF
jgi:hypothetical protein